MRINVPGQHKYDLKRENRDMFVLPIWEKLCDEVADDPSILTRVDEAIERGDFDLAEWNENEIVNTPGAPVLPIALYIDTSPPPLTTYY